ncbi:MAG: MMPL family transporter [Planctomycetota bacterium]|nr:MMPL family transporter [Planctomycetota bacterium]
MAKSDRSASISERALGLVALTSCRHPFWILGVAAVLGILSIAMLTRARITSDVLSLLPDDLEAVRTFREAQGSFEESRLLFVLISYDGPDRLSRLGSFAASWKEALSSRAEIERVEFKNPGRLGGYLDIFSRAFFQYLPEETVAKAIEALADDDEIRRRVRVSRTALRSAPASSQRIRHDPLGLAEFALGAMQGSEGTFRLDLESDLMITPDHRHLLFTIVGHEPPANLDYARSLLAAVREGEVAARRQTDAADRIETAYTGGYLFALDEERTIKRDLLVTIVTSLLAIHALFILAFRRIRALLFVGIPLTLGILWTFGFFILCLGEEMVAGTAVFSAILAGLGIDFAIHYLNRFEEELQTGASLEQAIHLAVVRTGGANLAAALTTSATFAAFLITRFKGFTQIGFLAGSGILFCLLSMTTVMPALLRLLGKKRAAGSLPGFGLGRLGDSVERRPGVFLRLSIGATLLALLYGALGLGGLEFETDARELRPEGDVTVAVQERIERTFGGAFTFALIAVPGESEEQVLQETEALLPHLRSLVDREVIASFHAVTSLLPSESRQQAARDLLRATLPPDRISSIRRILDEEGFRPDAFDDALQRLDEALRAERIVTARSLDEAGFGPLLERYLREGEQGPVGVIYLYPKVNLWDGPSRARWISQVQEVLPSDRAKLTGIVLLSQELAALVQEDFYRAAGLALVAILIISAIHFRDPLLVGLALLPVLLGAIWMVAGMILGGIDLNYMNIIIFPMILGLGVDDGIHLVHRFREGPHRSSFLIRGTGRAILLTSLTTIIGFGSLTLAKHRGVSSIGLVSVIGISTCLATSMFLLPPLLATLKSRIVRDPTEAGS